MADDELLRRNDRLEDVVEVVSDSGGELTQRGEAVLLAKVPWSLRSP
jgi:hypothetical protein